MSNEYNLLYNYPALEKQCYTEWWHCHHRSV